MAILRRVMAPLAPLKHSPWPLSTVIASRLDMTKPIEEENTPYYKPETFYPARLGEVLNNRYQLATKLGYRSNSTIWLARDLNQWRWLKDKYVAVKINRTSPILEKGTIQTELDTLQLISTANPQHKGYYFVRHLLGSFHLEYESKKSSVLVFEPLREPLWLYRQRFIGDTIPSDVLKIMVQMILHGLDYLHSECHIIHTDLKPDNIMVKIDDPSILEESAIDEYKNPLPQKIYPDGRTIYLSQNNYGLPRKTTGIIQITDFDLSVRGDKPNNGCIQAEIYRAPEVILDAGYSYSTDIWNLGVILWDVLEGKKLFKDIDPIRVHDYDELNHHTYNGTTRSSPERSFKKGEEDNALLRIRSVELCFTASITMFYAPIGTFKGPTFDPASFNFENVLKTIKGDDKTMFIEFVKRMMKWRPEDRSTAKELLQDPWLYAELEDD